MNYRKAFVLVLAAAFSFAACNVLENLIKIPIRVNSELTIPAGTGIGIVTDVFAGETETNIEEELELNDSRLDRLKTVELRECVLTVTSPSGGDFSFLNRIEVYLESDTLGDILIASRESIPSDVGSELTLNVEGSELVEYLKEGTITLRTAVVTDEILLTDYDVNVFTRFRVTADIF